MTIKDIKQKYSKKVEQAEIDLLLSFALKKPVEFILSYPELKLTKKQEEKINTLIARRKDGEPLAYLVGKKEFFGLDFFVNKNVLIPRPETELMIEEILDELEKGNNKEKISVLDIGCGSGNIIISLSKNVIRKNVKFLASDVSKEALNVARKNANNLDGEKNIKFFLSDLLENKRLRKELKNTNHLIIAANLPYVPEKYLEKKPTKKTSGLRYEPRLALAGGKDGLDVYIRLLKQSLSIKEHFPKLKITSLYEIEPKQKDLILKMIKKEIPRIKISDIKKDISGKFRICKLTL